MHSNIRDFGGIVKLMISHRGHSEHRDVFLITYAPMNVFQLFIFNFQINDLAQRTQRAQRYFAEQAPMQCFFIFYFLKNKVRKKDSLFLFFIDFVGGLFVGGLYGVCTWKTHDLSICNHE